jgi:hypothetical protein
VIAWRELAVVDVAGAHVVCEGLDGGVVGDVDLCPFGGGSGCLDLGDGAARVARGCDDDGGAAAGGFEREGAPRPMRPPVTTATVLLSSGMVVFPFDVFGVRPRRRGG